MTLSDLDQIHHPAAIDPQTLRITVRHLDLTPQEFVLSGLVLVDLSADEESLLVRAGLLTDRASRPSYKRRSETLYSVETVRQGEGYQHATERLVLPSSFERID